MNRLDQYYTMRPIAWSCVRFFNKCVKNTDDYLFMEPSAGDGAFYNVLPEDRRMGIDIDPKAPGISRGNFLRTYLSGPQRVIVIGNPPFGKNSSIAVKFFNHAAEHVQSDFIAFIVPKTFRKVSIQNRLSMDFHLIAELNLPETSFIKDDKNYAVPCCFQIWQRKPIKREPVKISIENPWFNFVKKSEKPDLAVRRVGWKSGICTREVTKCKEESFYFLKVKDGVVPAKLDNYINLLRDYGHFDDTIRNTAGARSLSKSEFIDVLKKNPFTI